MVSCVEQETPLPSRSPYQVNNPEESFTTNSQITTVDKESDFVVFGQDHGDCKAESNEALEPADEFIPLGTSELENGDSTSYSANYERNQRVCFRCGEPDHVKKDCKASFTEAARFKRKSEEQLRTAHRELSLVYKGRVPWLQYRRLLQGNDIGAVAYESSVVGLHEEILDFMEYMSPLEEERALRQDLIDRITVIINSVWPKAIVKVFGSFPCGLYTPSSDIDLVVLGQWPKSPLFSLAQLLEQHMELSKVQVIPKARVPIVKITDALTKVEVDISFNMDSGPSTAALIQKHVADFPVLLPLTFVVKHFLVQRSLNEVYTGGLNSYGIISMIISFLQLHPRIDTPKSLDDVNLGVLLIEFFELYGKNFNYEVVGISLLNGGSYFNKWVASWDKSPFSIRDPLDEANDVTCRSSNMKRIRIAFAHAYAVLVSKLLNRGLHPSLTTLSSIVNIHPEAILARRNALYNWLQRGKTLSRPEDIEQLRLPVRLLLQTSIPAEDGHLPAPDEVKAGGSDTEEVDELTIAGNEYTESGTLSEDSDENIDDDGYTDINYQEVDGSGNAAAQNSP